MTRAALAFATLFAAAAAWAAEPLDAAGIEAALAGATTSGVNAYGNPYTVRILENGTMEGVAGADDEYADSGSWWLEGDAFCRRWNAWLEATTSCFAVTIVDGEITWQDVATGASVVESYSPQQ